MTKFGINQICGVQQSGNAGEIGLGGPNWPSSDSTSSESALQCAIECNTRSDCNFYIWFDDLGCRLQSTCTETVDGYTAVTSYICEKGKSRTFDVFQKSTFPTLTPGMGGVNFEVVGAKFAIFALTYNVQFWSTKSTKRAINP